MAHGIDEVEADSVINRTPLGRRTEGMLEVNDPARSLPRAGSKSLMDAEYALGHAVVRDVDDSDLRGGYEGPNAFLHR